MPGTITPAPDDLEAICARPTTKTAMLDLVQAWRRVGWMAIEEGDGGTMRVWSLIWARTMYKEMDGWKGPYFERNPDLRDAAQLYKSIEQIAPKVEELYSLTIPGNSWEPDGLPEAWAQLHRLLKRARPSLPSLPKLAAMP